jgi:hypothetical protein
MAFDLTDIRNSPRSRPMRRYSLSASWETSLGPNARIFSRMNRMKE